MLFELAIRPLLYAGLVALAFAPLEHLFPLRAGRRTQFRKDVAFATLGAILTRALLFGVAGMTLWASEALWPILGDGLLAQVPPAIGVPIGLVVFELGGYAYHRAAHRVPWLWRLHRVHHSSTQMDWLASFRQHPLEIALMTLAQNLPLVLLGLPLGVHALVVILLKLNTTFVHANLRTPRFVEPFVATPRFHHRHHDANAKDANFASLFPWLDRLFGTFDASDAGELGLRTD